MMLFNEKMCAVVKRIGSMCLDLTRDTSDSGLTREQRQQKQAIDEEINELLQMIEQHEDSRVKH